VPVDASPNDRLPEKNPCTPTDAATVLRRLLMAEPTPLRGETNPLKLRSPSAEPELKPRLPSTKSDPHRGREENEEENEEEDKDGNEDGDELEDEAGMVVVVVVVVVVEKEEEARSGRSR